jgi:hypothetical protein
VEFVLVVVIVDNGAGLGAKVPPPRDTTRGAFCLRDCGCGDDLDGTISFFLETLLLFVVVVCEEEVVSSTEFRRVDRDDGVADLRVVGGIISLLHEIADMNVVCEYCTSLGNHTQPIVGSKSCKDTVSVANDAERRVAK